MKQSVWKLTWRSIRSFFGRYIALLLITVLSVGFFAGLKITKDAMSNTCGKYLTEHGFYDFRLISTLGFEEEDMEKFSEISSVKCVEGSKSAELIAETKNGTNAYRFISLPKEINTFSLTAGRQPQTAAECVADAEYFTLSDIGTTITISSDNEQEKVSQLSYNEYTIVGLADSPLYLNADRGTTDIGNGTLAGYIYLSEECFTSEVYAEVFLILNETAEIYSDAYDNLIEENEDAITAICQNIIDEKYAQLLSDMNLTPVLAEEAGISEPEKYILTRNENAGYISFENDTSIISGVANIFPLFFILIAMLVCITTMTRMVDEERTQIGTLKAMGFSDKAITAKYLIYAGSAALVGWVVGFFLGTWGLPKVFWFAYASLYDFAPLGYLFSLPLAVGTLAVTLTGILASTWISCHRDLTSNPAALIRPNPPKSGKHILLERVKPVWDKLSFLQKVSLRNILRYKCRLVMMLIGIGCCTALVLTAFGVRDSMINVGTLQYEEVQRYDMEAGFDSTKPAEVKAQLDKISEEYVSAYTTRVDLSYDKAMKSVKLIAFEKDVCNDFWDFADGENKLPLPQIGEALISTKVSDEINASVGDVIEVQNTEMQTLSVKVSGIFNNYVDNYIVLSPDEIISNWNECESNTFFIRMEGSAEKIMHIEGISSASSNATSKENINNALSCLNYIIWMIVLFSGALTFIVIYNLTNINITERSREIATVQVLGFYPKETESYILRENLVLSVIAGILGLPLGVLFHKAVMSMILISSMTFQVKINFISYVLALICTLLFAFIVNLSMKQRIGKVNMTESLKSVE